ncbi:MAG TPA: GspMb/PilO family protein, partial [Terriglobales bacterium]|nr:GspMb/PilO family protein [Terriglobales bacterium]
ESNDWGSRSNKRTSVRSQQSMKQLQVNKVGDMDQKIASASQQITAFYQSRIPVRDSVIADSLSKIAQESGVRLEQVKYSPKDTVPAGLRPMEIEANLSGQYPQLARFLNSVERNQPVFFVVDSIELAGEQTAGVKLQVKLRTFVRAGA